MENLTVVFGDWYFDKYDVTGAAFDRERGIVYSTAGHNIFDDMDRMNVMYRTKTSLAEEWLEIEVLDLGFVKGELGKLNDRQLSENKWMEDNMGKLFTDGLDVYLLSQVGFGKFCLVNVKTGNRLTDPSFKKSDIFYSSIREAKGWNLELHQIED